MSNMRLAKAGEADRLGEVKARIMSSIKDEIESGEASKVEVLALMAHVTGMCAAMQDQREISGDRAMEIIGMNIEAGNKSAIEQMLKGDFPHTQ